MQHAFLRAVFMPKMWGYLILWELQSRHESMYWQGETNIPPKKLRCVCFVLYVRNEKHATISSLSKPISYIPADALSQQSPGQQDWYYHNYTLCYCLRHSIKQVLVLMGVSISISKYLKTCETVCAGWLHAFPPRPHLTHILPVLYQP